jgi:hypothetical protein
MIRYLTFVLVLITISCNSAFVGNRYNVPEIEGSYATSKQPPAPDYSNPNDWAALPEKHDFADSVPNKTAFDDQANALVDVFFIHPTLYLDKPANEYIWNADVNDLILNRKVDESTILNQASVFNGSCRIYAPRYRQAHIAAFYTPDQESGKAALDLAYLDVKHAFEYFLAHYNNGRPFIIAGHSQGTQHAGKIVKEYIEGKELQKQMVAAYLVGMPVTKEHFSILEVCKNPGEVNCFLSWATYQEGYLPPNYKSARYEDALCVNPLSWKTDSIAIPRSENLGGITWKFHKVVPRINGAQVHRGILWIDKPHVPGRSFIHMNNYHVADYNLFWFNIRKNVKMQTETYLGLNR